MSEQRDDRVDDSVLGSLLRSSGRGPRLSDTARARIYEDVHSRWAASVAPDGNVTQLRPNLRRRNTLRWFALAATVAAIAILVIEFRVPIIAPGATFANVVRVEGRATVERDGQSLIVGDDGSAAVRVGDRLLTGRDGRLALRLATGQLLRIDSGADVTIADAASVDLNVGTVYFDSLRGENEPFRVETPLGAVRHVGTQYEASFNSARLRVRVREGSALIGSAIRDVEANAGEQLQISFEGDISRSAFATDDPAWQWVEGLAVVDPASEHNLLEILMWVSRETGVELQFDGAETEARVGSIVVSGLSGFNPREALDAISTTTEFSYRLDNGRLLVSSSSL